MWSYINNQMIKWWVFAVCLSPSPAIHWNIEINPSFQTDVKIEFYTHVTHKFHYWMVYVYKANIATVPPATYQSLNPHPHPHTGHALHVHIASNSDFWGCAKPKQHKRGHHHHMHLKQVYILPNSGWLTPPNFFRWTITLLFTALATPADKQRTQSCDLKSCQTSNRISNTSVIKMSGIIY